MSSHEGGLWDQSLHLSPHGFAVPQRRLPLRRRMLRRSTATSGGHPARYSLVIPHRTGLTSFHVSAPPAVLYGAGLRGPPEGFPPGGGASAASVNRRTKLSWRSSSARCRAAAASSNLEKLPRLYRFP